MTDDQERSEPTRRKTLQLLGTTSIGLLGTATGNVAASRSRRQKGKNSTASETKRDQESGEVVIAKGSSGPVTSNSETPEWFHIESADGVEWEIGDFTKKPSQEPSRGIRAQDHLDCPGDQLDWGGTLSYAGIDFTLHLDHCAGTCNWDFQAEALHQTASTGMNENCNADESISLGAKPLRVTIDIRAEGTLPATEAVEYWDVDLTIDYYDPRYGYSEKNTSFRIDNPAADVL